ncbi:factor-independent urate hydroxylase [Actinoplanes teichomyceticus]|uniref:factor-independent urate hydroxylase n=1 Tax=Actinoplanes teichomyceticus TaxID=1867 RepID=UPI001EF26FB7|nr:urate oxidase [Actinoplanes teichomyceticus]
MLGPNRYGKAETRLVRVHRDGDMHRLVDFTVGVALAGDLAATHLTGDNSGVLPTDTMKNTVYALAKQHGVDEPETFALLLARHFMKTQGRLTSARVSVESFGWDRLGPHSFRRRGEHTRTTAVTVTREATQVVSGVTGLVLLNTTASEFHGFVKDRYTTLPETTDRILATAVDARWRHLGDEADWGRSFQGAVDAMTGAFVNTYSYSLQQTLMAMGTMVLAGRPEIAEIRLALPNKHHYLVDLSPFGLDNDNEVFIAGDRPYGLIEGTVTRDDVPPADAQWYL